MSFLDKIRLGRKKIRPVGSRLETGIKDSDGARRRKLVAKFGMIGALIALTILAFPGDEFKVDAREGDIWNAPTLLAPYSFSILKDPAQLREEKDQVKYQTPPLFEEIDWVSETVAHRDTVANQLDRILSTYQNYVTNTRRGLTAQATADSLRYLSLRHNARLKLSPSQWDMLIEDYASRIPGMVTSSRSELGGQRLDRRMLDEAYADAIDIPRFGAIDIPLDSIYTDVIVIRSEEEQAELEKPVSEVYGMNEAYDKAEGRFESIFQDNREYVNLASGFFRAIFQPSYAYLPVQTERRLLEKQNRIPINDGVVERGEIVVQQGDLITSETLRKIQSLQQQQNLRRGNKVGWRVLTGRFILTIASFFFFFMYLFALRRKIFDDNKLVFLIAILFGVIIGLFAAVVRLDFASIYIVPVAIASVILTVIFDSRVALFGTVTLALLGGQLVYFDYAYTFATILAGALGIYSVRDIKNRSQFFVSSGLVMVGYVLVLVAMFLVQGTTADLFVSNVLQSGINSFLIIVAFPLLWVFEKLFDITTDLTLLELSDTNRPLLKELSIRAPGTFNHTLQVANLAEAAADAVGANALLTRVGALYHDIGKMHKPEYFVENQHPGDNPHDNLKPRMSALIIASHVKEGLEIAREYNLPKLVEDFIPMHHGTSLIEYFYRRAQEASDNPDEISESEFRYPGPRPNSKESGILMLADSVEAAGRSIESPTHKRFENLIDGLFASRIADGQLAETNLNFQELDKIKETFLSMLVSMYHVRVKYPGQEEGEKVDELATGEQPLLEEGDVDSEQQSRVANGGDSKSTERKTEPTTHPVNGTDSSNTSQGESS